MKRSVLRAAALATVTALASCGAPTGSGHTLPTASQARGGVRILSDARRPLDIAGGIPTITMHDAPLTGAHAYIGFKSIGWVGASGPVVMTSFDTPNVIEVSALVRSAAQFYGSNVPAGTYSQIQVAIDLPSSYLVAADGSRVPIVAPGGANSLTVTMPITPVTTNGSGPLRSAFDFNLLESVKWTPGQSVAMLQPRFPTTLDDASIAGTVVNRAGAPVVGATIVVTDAKGKTVNTGSSAADGTFQINALDAGTYTVSINNNYLTYAGITVTATGNDPDGVWSQAVNAPAGTTLNLGTLID